MSEQQHLRLTGRYSNDFRILRLSGTEALGRPFDVTADLLATSEDIPFPDVLGGKLTLSLELEEGERYFDGCVVAFSQVGRRGRYALYRARLRPWFWYLSLTRDCRIFQNQSVPEIIQTLFSEHGQSDFEDALSQDYEPREYCVQYRESDFDFLSRLMEEEGIYYFFRHAQGQHVLVLADAPVSHERIPGCEEVSFFPPETERGRAQDHVWDWWLGQQIQTELFALRDFDFENPRNPPEAKESRPREHLAASYEAYDYPGRFLQASPQGSHLAAVRSDESQTQFEQIKAIGNLRALMCGGLFELKGHPRGDQNREYLVTASEIDIRAAEYEATAQPEKASSRCTFSAIDSGVCFRPARLTPRPVVQGLQTAIVVGKAGEEIWTDRYGRVKCQFHWDRQGAKDENSSCWVRVSQSWAGSGWGGMFVPRIGQEVIVAFLEGDPDRPIVVGRVYNADCMPPFDLPDQAMVGGVKSNSTPGGGGYNEISMNDTAGEELLHVHAQKDQDTVVGNDERHAVGNDRTRSVGNDEQTTIGNDRSETVGSNETIQIGANRTEAVGGSESVAIGQNRTHTVSGNDVLNVAMTRTQSVGVNDMINVAGAQETNVGGLRSVIVGGLQSLAVGASLREAVAGSRDEQVGGNRSSAVGSSDSLSVGQGMTVTVGKGLSIEAGDQVVMRTGQSSITMKKDGSITIQGKDITIQGSGGVQIKAGKDVVIKGKKILQN
ncbi:type VI secretion system tip protein VgrG [Halomonas campisalis]|uniref:Type VI secretion system tip protein VgrG n=1 Tax=Billgrantia campisalis TaxID=74661 RepID=A0ABS9P8G8_9GAMM|nr:type VI secretion system tip protein VgrG [Halomonas campisalis]MCG6657502.1 type VI secretion system tip protein VgrG [Halomonas campisalis]MDR5863151.1 type VI secretion system tip protein TssI/VgrG [Halomonas campisalis]